jgi:hypothetical protein
MLRGLGRGSCSSARDNRLSSAANGLGDVRAIDLPSSAIPHWGSAGVRLRPSGKAVPSGVVMVPSTVRAARELREGDVVKLAGIGRLRAPEGVFVALPLP